MKGSIKNATIISTKISTDPVLSAWLILEFDGTGQGFGGYCLYNKNHVGDCGGQFLQRVLEVVGVDEWEKLKGKNIRVDHDMSKIYGIGNIIKNEWFYPSEELK